MYRLIALDIDDTITLNPRVVPNEIIEAVRKAMKYRRSSLRRFSGRRRYWVYTPISIRVTR